MSQATAFNFQETLYKYLDFAITNINNILSIFYFTNIPLANIALPIGISFYCFQAMSYTIDVYRETVNPQYNLKKFVLYISLFPQLIAGPIVRYSDIFQQLNNRNLILANVYEGIVRFCIGLAKKILIADTMGAIADKIFISQPEQIPTAAAWMGSVAYALQIYYDFSAYSDMAIGLGLIFNFHFLENFKFPYGSCSISDFWQRWHISLSSWLKDYLYIPLGGNKISRTRTYVNQLIVFFLCGLWHGASWNFVAWGLWHGLGLIIEKTTFIHFLQKCPKPIANGYVLIFVIIGWVFFRSPDLPYAMIYLKNMFLGNQSYDIYSFMPLWTDCLTFSNMLLLVTGCIFAYPIQRFSHNCLMKKNTGILTIFLVFIASFLFAMTNSFSPFIYFRF
ncbi:MBOAT family O-acyltransferase [Desulfobulbus propionicus]|uniref:MBOAT family O-acyltransferase n=1 Tax=Desulfobulbus propionicus TaxID=894 RepID=UPI00030814ED|nr:MBOAT family O-acyltransferase [Desulfobulbus propionicus]